jgi:hypothetical protein
MSGTIDGTAAAMFDLTTIDKTNDDLGNVWTVIQFSESSLPPFVCETRSWQTRPPRRNLSPINFDPSAEDELTRQTVASFQRRYVLGLSDTMASSAEDGVRRLFCASRLAAIAKHPRWHIHSADGALVFAVDRTAKAADRPALWHEAVALRRIFLAPVHDSAGPIPAAPGMDVDRQRNRRFGRRAGGFAGAAVGCIVGFIAVVALMGIRVTPRDGRMRRQGAAPVVALFGFIPGSVAVCAIVGAWLGGRVADLRYQYAALCISRIKTPKG